jgi:hypothetical protein
MLKDQITHLVLKLLINKTDNTPKPMGSDPSEEIIGADDDGQHLCVVLWCSLNGVCVLLWPRFVWNLESTLFVARVVACHMDSVYN